jgi:hypothetical protein
LSDDQLHRQEWIAERAGILEHDAGYPRIVAEALAKAMWSDYQRARSAQEATS